MQLENMSSSAWHADSRGDQRDGKARQSLVTRVANAIREQVRQGSLAEGSQLRAEVDLARDLGVSRPTLREATRLLALEGLLTVRHGAGTFVAKLSPSLNSPLNSMQSMSALIRASGAESFTTGLKVRSIAATAEVASALKIEHGQQVVEIVRVRLIDDRPLAIAHDYIPIGANVPGLLSLLKTFDGSSIYGFLDLHLQTRFVSSEASVTAVAAGKRQATKLKVRQGFPLLLIREVHIDDQHRRGLYSTVFHNSALMCFTLVRPGRKL